MPNLVTVNEGDVVRSNTRDDFLCYFVDPNQDLLDCTYGMQRAAGGSDQLVPEESVNTNLGIVLEPVAGLTLTLDFWEIEKERTIGLFGEENHTALDLLLRLQAGTADCASVVGNPLVVREDPSTLGAPEQQLYLDAGLCPIGQVIQVQDTYANLDTRTVRGHDVGVYYEFETPIGDFDLRYLASFLDKYEQVAGGAAAQLIAAQESGQLPANVPVIGFADLVQQDGNAREKHTIRLGWKRGRTNATLSGVRNGSFIQTSLTLADADNNPIYYLIPSMTTWNLNASYRLDSWRDYDTRLRFGINNLFDERAPLADRSFGYFADMHTDLGINYFAEVRLGFK